MTDRRALTLLLQDIGVGTMDSTAYDTAWVARLHEVDDALGENALNWLRENQLADGSWGAHAPNLFSDRFVCTLSAAIALTKYGDANDKEQLNRARSQLEAGVTRLFNKPMQETVGFEMIVPTLLDEAETLNIIQNGDHSYVDHLRNLRSKKLATLPQGTVNRHVTPAFSSEMAGSDMIHVLDIDNLQEANGSVGHSPSATAYFTLNINQNDREAFDYLRQVPLSDGGVPGVASFDLFERTWTLWNLALLDPFYDDLQELFQSHLDYIQMAWKPGKGVGFADGYTPVDSDDTSVAYQVLVASDRNADIEDILHYEEITHFRCYELETNPSISANIHVLGALRKAGFKLDDQVIQKVLKFIGKHCYWTDKWHASPYYPTSHLIIATAGYADDLVEDAVAWIKASQRKEGAWGYYSPTAEETAYCLQALGTWKLAGHSVNNALFERGLNWLESHKDPPYPPLWIGKCLYTPVHVVRATVLSACELARQVLQQA